MTLKKERKCSMNIITMQSMWYAAILWMWMYSLWPHLRPHHLVSKSLLNWKQQNRSLVLLWRFRRWYQVPVMNWIVLWMCWINFRPSAKQHCRKERMWVMWTKPSKSYWRRLMSWRIWSPRRRKCMLVLLWKRGWGRRRKRDCDVRLRKRRNANAWRRKKLNENAWRRRKLSENAKRKLSRNVLWRQSDCVKKLNENDWKRRKLSENVRRKKPRRKDKKRKLRRSVRKRKRLNGYVSS